MVKAQVLVLFAVTAFANYSDEDSVDYAADFDSSVLSGSAETSLPSYNPLDNYFTFGSDEDDGYSTTYSDDNYGHEGRNVPGPNGSIISYSPEDFSWYGEEGLPPDDPGLHGGATAVDASGDPEERTIASVDETQEKKDADAPTQQRDLVQECLDRGFSIESCCKTCIENYIAAWARGECSDITGDCVDKATSESIDGGVSGGTQ